MGETLNGAELWHLNLKNNLHGRVKYLINDTLLFNKGLAVNHLLRPLMYMMSLGDTKKPRTYQFLFYVYKTDNHMEEHAPKLNNTDISPPEFYQVTKLTKYYEVDQDPLDSGEEDD